MISVIIPTYNEAEHIVLTIRRLREHDGSGLIKEVIVSDGGSSDGTVALAAGEGVKAVVSPEKGRAAQMNYGASLATTGILYFLHADTIPPQGFTKNIMQAIDRGYQAGCFMLSFDHHHWFLKANCWFTRFDVDAFRYGDQSLFVQQNTFREVNGFSEKHIVFEDHHIIRQIKKKGRFAIVKRPVITSARKYTDNGIFKLQGIFFLMYFMYILGFSQQRLVSTYKKMVRQNKL